MILQIQPWVINVLLSAAGGAIIIMLGVIGFFMRKWMLDMERARRTDNERFAGITQKTSESIDRLNNTIKEISRNLDVFQTSIAGELGSVREMAIRAERQGISNTEELVDQGIRITRVETYCKTRHER